MPNTLAVTFAPVIAMTALPIPLPTQDLLISQAAGMAFATGMLTASVKDTGVMIESADFATAQAGITVAFLKYFKANNAVGNTIAPPIYLALALDLVPIMTAFWNSVVFSSVYAGMPSGHLSFIPPCNVLSPGIFNPAPIIALGAVAMTPGAPVFEPLILTFVASCIAHMLTVSGLHTAVVPPPLAGPYPLPWVGVE